MSDATVVPRERTKVKVKGPRSDRRDNAPTELEPGNRADAVKIFTSSGMQWKQESSKDAEDEESRCESADEYSPYEDRNMGMEANQIEDEFDNEPREEDMEMANGFLESYLSQLRKRIELAAESRLDTGAVSESDAPSVDTNKHESTALDVAAEMRRIDDMDKLIEEKIKACPSIADSLRRARTAALDTSRGSAGTSSATLLGDGETTGPVSSETTGQELSISGETAKPKARSTGLGLFITETVPPIVEEHPSAGKTDNENQDRDSSHDERVTEDLPGTKSKRKVRDGEANEELAAHAVNENRGWTDGERRSEYERGDWIGRNKV
ncbi:hypothetical protein HDU93_005095, partial [Gonapodya sp. JEL0774]